MKSYAIPLSREEALPRQIAYKKERLQKLKGDYKIAISEYEASIDLMNSQIDAMEKELQDILNSR